MKLIGVRRTVRGDETIPTVTLEAAEHLLPLADHVIDILPASCETEYFFNANRFPRMKPTAVFYNIGRGSTVDQIILQEMLETNKIAAAYLDVATPEPLPPEDLLWHLPNCFLTPTPPAATPPSSNSSAQHFLDNLKRYTSNQPLNDRII